MCLDRVDDKVTFQEYGVYYKVFGKVNLSAIKGEIMYHHRLPIGEWLDEFNYRPCYFKDEPRDAKIDEPGSPEYEVGFHCFTTKEAAKWWSSEDLHLTIRKVKVRDIVAQGSQSSVPKTNCIVAKQIKII